MDDEVQNVHPINKQKNNSSKSQNFQKVKFFKKQLFTLFLLSQIFQNFQKQIKIFKVFFLIKFAK